MPSNEIWLIVSYATDCALRTESASPTTHSTRPPDVVSLPSASVVPAWKVTESPVSAGISLIRSPLRGVSG
jgi:hypothetical protein